LAPPNSQLGNFLNSSLPPQESVDPNLLRGTLYGYYHWEPLAGLKLIGGLTYDHLTLPVNYRYAPLAGGEETKEQISPKGGIIWSPLEGLALRAAYACGVTGVHIDESFQLEQTQIAGLTQIYRSVIREARGRARAGEESETSA